MLGASQESHVCSNNSTRCVDACRMYCTSSAVGNAMSDRVQSAKFRKSPKREFFLQILSRQGAMRLEEVQNTRVLGGERNVCLLPDRCG